jgi:5-methylcytosine-specific restriction endonuclease McrA
MSWNTSNRRERLPRDWFTRIRPHILKRDPYCKLRYRMCQGVSTQVDHIERGDDHSYTNLQGVCSSCHAIKSAREGRQAQLTRRQRRLRSPEEHPRDGIIASRPQRGADTDDST